MSRKSSALNAIGRVHLTDTTANVLMASSASESDHILLRLESGQEFRVPAHQLEVQEDGTCRLPYSESELEIREAMKGLIDEAPEDEERAATERAATERAATERAATESRTPAGPAALDPPIVADHGDSSAPDSPLAIDPPSDVVVEEGEERVIPVVREEARVEKVRRETGTVRIEKEVVEREETVDVPLIREEVDIRRVPVGRVVDAPPPIRVEGDTTIISLVEEEIVIRKRLVLKEELHVRLVQSEAHEPQTVRLLSEEARVVRTDASQPHADDPSVRGNGEGGVS